RRAHSISFLLIIEHVPTDIFALFRSLANILSPGGFLVVATPFLTEIHRFPSDCWRITPEAYGLLVAQAGLEMVTCSSWGNRAVWLYIALGHRMAPVPEDPDHPINKLATFNEPLWPIHVWMIARKPVTTSTMT